MIKSLVIAFNRVVLGRIKCISVGPEQDETEELESWMGASKSNSFGTMATLCLRKQRSIIDEAVDGSRDADLFTRESVNRSIE